MEPPHDLASFVKAALAEAEHVAAAAKADSPDYRIAKALLLSHPPYADRDPLAELAHIELERLVHRCPMGFHEGKLRTLRSFVDADMIAWITELRTMVRGTPPEATVLPPPPISTGSGAEREWSERGWSAALTGLGPIPPGFVNGAVNRAVESVRSRIAERDPRRTDDGLSYRHVDRNPLASPAAEAEMRRRFGDGDGSIPGAEPERTNVVRFYSLRAGRGCTLTDGVARVPTCALFNNPVGRRVDAMEIYITASELPELSESTAQNWFGRMRSKRSSSEVVQSLTITVVGGTWAMLEAREAKRKLDREAARVRVQAFLWGRRADLNNAAFVDGLIDTVLYPSPLRDAKRILAAGTRFADQEAHFMRRELEQRAQEAKAGVVQVDCDDDPLHNHEDLGYHPDSCPRCKLGADNARKKEGLSVDDRGIPMSAARVTDARLYELSTQSETIALNGQSALEIRKLASELLDRRGVDDERADLREVVAVAERARTMDERVTKLEAAHAHEAARADVAEMRIQTIEEMAAAVPVGKADPGWGSSPLPLMWGNMKIPPGSFAAAFPGDLREVPRRGIRGGRSSNISSGAMPKMSDDPLEWDEQRALDRHPDLLPLLSRSAIRAALWERSEWVKPAALGDAPKPHMDSVLTVGELDDIRKTCETYSSDSCWRKLLAAFDATTASLKAARERFNDELGKAIDGVKRDLVEQKAQTDRWMRKESEAIHSSIPYRDAVREIFQMTGNPEGDPARAVEIVRRIREVNARARAKAQPKELTVDPDSDFAKIARGETPSFSFEVTTVPNVPDRVEMVFGRNGAPATTIRHRNGCTAGDCLGCGVTPALAAEAADDNARIAESLERSGPRLYAEQSAAGRAEASAHVLSLEDFRTAIRAVSEGGVVSAGAIASFLVECYGPRTKGVVVELRDMLVKRAELTCFPQLPAWQATQPEIDLLASVLVELDKLIAAAIKDVSAAVGRIEARPEDDIPF